MTKFSCLLTLWFFVAAMCNPLHASPHSAKPGQASAAQKGTATTSQDEAGTPDDKTALSDGIIQDVLEPIRSGMETQNIKQILSAFDKGGMPSYSDLEQQLHAFFRQFDQVRFRYQILQAALDDSPDKDRVTATAEIDMDAMPFDITQLAVRRSVQMHFILKHEAKGWKVTSYTPADYFNVDYGAK